jgi:Protein O-mannosyl-transferase TMEM260-like
MAVRPRLRWGRLDWVITALVFAASLGLYLATLAPTISSTSFDSAELITKSGILQTAHTPGSPVYVWLGHLYTYLPFGDLAYRVNLMSASLGALTVVIIYVITARYLTGERLSAIGAAALFGLSLTFWSQAVISELYAPNIGFVAVVVLALLEWSAAKGAPGGDKARGRWWLVAAALVFGLSLGIHLSNVLYLPAFGAFALLGLPVPRDATGRVRLRFDRQTLGRIAAWIDWRGEALCVAAGVLAVVLPYGWEYFDLPNIPTGDNFPKVAPGWPLFYEVTLNAFKGARFAYTWGEIPDRIAQFLHLFERNLGGIGVALTLLGAWRLLFTRLRLFYLLVLLFLANAIFYVNYKVPDNDVYYIPAYFAAACFAGVGLEAVIAGLRVLFSRRGEAWRYARVAVPWAGAGALVISGAWWALSSNYESNDLSSNLSFRDYYGNTLSTSVLPQGAYLYHRGASLGYDLLYYTKLCGVRPDLHVQAGLGPNEPAPGDVPWPPGPVYSSVTKHDDWLPNFIADPQGNNLKWYDPLLTGMFRWQDGAQFGWLNLYRVRKADDVPQDWMVSIDSPASHPSQKLDIKYTSLLSLVGVDADPVAYPGKPWHMTRYWYATGNWIPPFVTVLGKGGADGQHIAMESHTPLYGQFEDYVKARNITDLGLYVIRDDMHLVIPSNLAPGRYTITTALAKDRLLSLVLDPAPPDELLRQEELTTTVDVVADPGAKAPDPLAQATNGRCMR